MVAIKPAELSSFLKSPAKRAEVFLVHGADAGQVAEHAKAIATQLCAATSPPGEILRLTDQDLAQTPGRLAMEARSLPMFGGRPVIMVRHAPQLTPAIFEDLLGGSPLAGFVIVEAGNLKRDAKIRQLFEREKNAAAIACYGADERGLQQLIRDDVKAAGLTITSEAAERLAGLLGGDWAVSRSEIAKLTLYSADADGGEITVEHVDAIVGDSSAHAFEAAIAATLIGNATEALAQIDGLAAAGTPASVILNVLLRHLQNLHTVAAAIQRGEAFETAVRHLRPPPHFKAKDALRAQVSRWRAGAVAAAVGETHEAVRQTRLKPALEHEITSELVIRLAREGQEGQKIKAGTARFQR